MRSPRRAAAHFASAALTAIIALSVFAPQIAQAATWSSESPYGVLKTTPSALSVDVVQAGGIDTRTAKISVDGHALSTQVSQGTSNGQWTSVETLVNGVYIVHWTWTPLPADGSRATILAYTAPLGTGLHNVSVEAKDRSGAPISDAWSFRVSAPPVFGAVTPLPNSTLATTTPAITVAATDDTGIAACSATVNGVAASAHYASGKITVTGFTLADGPVTVVVSATDTEGNSTDITWSFTIDTSSLTCTTCHGTSYATDNAMGPKCTQCHSGKADPHANPDALHTPAVLTGICTTCHQTSIVKEHAARLVSCAACHNSTDPNVTLAIASGDSNCSSCHPSYHAAGDLALVHAANPPASTYIIDSKEYPSLACSTCHGETSLLTIHNNSCTTCHPSPVDSVPDWTKSCSEGNCHTPGNQAPMHGSINTAHEHNSANDGCFVAGCHDDLADASLAEIHKDATATVNGQSVTSCMVCHAQSGQLSNNCLSCHAERANPHGYDAAKHTAAPAAQGIVINGVSYTDAACADCHNLELGPEHQQGAASVPCAECHSGLVVGLGGWNKGCVQGGCHTVASTKPMHANATLVHTRSSATDSCFASGCHTDASTAAIHEGKSQTVNGQTRTSCMICHASGVTGANDCSTCHDLNSPHGDTSATHAATLTSTDISFGGKDYGTHQCSECHQSADLLTIHPNQCATCHPTPKDTLTPSWDKTCTQGGCHTAGSSAPMHSKLSTTHVISANSCTAAGCHKGAGNIAEVHASVDATVNGVELKSCQVCHAAGRIPSTTCSDCHDVDNPHPATSTHTVNVAGCALGSNCHSTNPGDVRTIHQNVTCQVCHGDGITPTTDCVTCHKKLNGDPYAAYNHGNVAPIHAAEVTGSITIVGTTFDNVVCADCHAPQTETSTTPNGAMTLYSLHDNGCPSCHPGIVPTKVPTWSGTCDQVGCHSTTDTDNLALKQPQHAGIDAAHSMVPVAKDCLAGGKCHTGTSLPQIHQNATLTENGKTYTGCQVCHKNSLDKPIVPDFTSPDGSVWSNECLGCHPDRWAQHGYNSSWHTSTDTSQVVTIDGATIGKVYCADCHARATQTSRGTTGTVELGPIHNGENLGCDNCHPSPRDTFTNWNKSCTEPGCHGDQSTRPEHGDMEAAHTPTPGTSCMIDGCHLGDTTAPGWGTSLPQIHKDATTTVDGQVVSSCLVCHFNNGYNPNGTGVTFTTDANGIPNTKECADCHPQGNNTMHAYSFTNHTSAPASQTITIGGTTFGPMPCTRCHFTELSSEHARNISGFKSKGCFNCHPDPYNSLEAPGQALGGWNKGCVQAGCHNPSGANAMHASVTASHTPLPENQSCLTGNACHTADGATIADMHSQATTTVAGVVRTSCDVCHGDYAKQSQPPTQNCTYCHPDKVLPNGGVSSHVDTDTLHPVTNSASCTGDGNSCHYDTLAKEHFRWKTKSGDAFTCDTCHSSLDPTTLAAIKNHDTSCAACHTNVQHGTSTPASNQSCQDCHGTSSAEISVAATSGAYDNTAGDHKTGFSAAAHSSIQTTPTVGSSPTTIQCTVCHNHSRDIPKKLDYRYTGWPSPDQNHEDLCYQCHTSTTTVVNEPGKPNTWNGRSVQSQFQLASKHAISTGSGSYVDQEVPNFSETAQSSFLTETRNNVQVTNVSGGEVKLGQDLSTAFNPGAQPALLFGKTGGSTAMSQFKTTDNAWNGSNSAAFTPASASFSPVSGSSAYRIPGDPAIYVVSGSSTYKYLPPADPTADSWSSAIATAAPGTTVGAGGDTAVDTQGTTTTGLCVYYLRGGSNNQIRWRGYTDTGANYGTFSSTLGAGAAIAYAPSSNRLFVIYRNGTAGDGKLYYMTASRPAAAAFSGITAGPSITTSSTASTVYNRLTCATIGGSDYLFSIGPNLSGSITLQVVTNVSSTPALLGIGIKAPGGWTSMGDGCDLKYNAADGYLYATRGGSNNGFARIKVPSNPGTASSWTGVAWETLTGGPTWAAGSSIEFADADPTMVAPFRYYTAGTFSTSSDIVALSGSPKWGKLTFTSVVPANTALSIKVQGYNSGTGVYDDLVSSASSPVDLGSYDTTTYPRVRLVATLSTNDPTNSAATPEIDDWAVSNVKQTYVPPTGSLLQCENCHNTHLVQKGSGAWDKSRVVDPSNGKVLFSSTGKSWAEFCLTCHTGPVDGSSTKTFTPFVSATNLIPYNVAFRPVTAPFFSGWNKSITGMDWANSGHNPTGGVESNQLSQTTKADFQADTLTDSVVTSVTGGEVKLAGGPLGTGFSDGFESGNTSAWTSADYVAQQGGSTNLLTEGFESNSWNTNTWTTSSSTYNTIQTTQKHAGTYAARIAPSGSSTTARYFQKTFNTSAYTTSNTLSYWFMTSGLVTGDVYRVGYSTNGGTSFTYVQNVTSTNVGSWTQITSSAIPANSSVIIRFELVPVSNAATTRYFYVDDISLDGVGPVVPERGWKAQNSVKNTGTYAATAIGGDSTTRYLTKSSISTTNAASVNATWSISWASLGSTDSVLVQTYDGSAWTTRKTYSPSASQAWTTDTLTGLPANTVGIRFAFLGAAANAVAYVDDVSLAPVSPYGNSYSLTGSVTSPEIPAPNGASRWGNLTFTLGQPSNTAAGVTLLGYNSTSSQWETLLSNQTVSPVSLAPYSISQYTKLKLLGALSTTVYNATPEIDDWTVTSIAPATGRPSCNNCHDPHGSNNRELVAYTSLDGSTVRDNSSAVSGSGLCYKCHGTGSGLYMDVQGPTGAGFGHSIANSGAIHSNEETAGDLATNRHADCSDCHNPHANQKGVHVAGSSNGGAVLDGVTGVNPNYSASSFNAASNWATPTAAGYSNVKFKSTTGTPEAYLCFKCHAGAGTKLVSVTTNSGTYTRTDLAQEFNPANASYHNVLGLSTGTQTTFTNVTNAAGSTFSQTWPIPSVSGALINGMNWNSKVTCTDCHTGGNGTTQARGPHGSSVKYMLDPNYSADWETISYTNRTASMYICRKCHDMSVTTNTGAHGGNHNNALCVQCHIAIPHGWKRPRMLVYNTDPAPYWKFGSTGAGLVAVSSSSNHSAGSTISWSQSDCGGGGSVTPTGGRSCSGHGNSSMTAKWK